MKRRPRSALRGAGALLWLALVVTTGHARAEDAKASLGSHDLELTPPDLSAFALLGINPNQVTRPGTAREFSAGVLTGAQADGTITSALAVEWSPITTWTPDNLQAYRDNVLWRRITLSGAALADGTTTGVAIGARWVVIDRSDPLSNEALHRQLEGELATLDQPRRTAFLNEAKDFIKAHTRFKEPSEDQAKLVGLFSLLRPIHELVESDLCAKAKAFLNEHAKRTGAAPSAAEVADEERELCRLAHDYAILRLLLLEDERAQLEAATRRVAEVKAAMRESVWNATTAQVGLGFVGRSADSRWENLEAERLRAFVNIAPGIGKIAQIIFQADVTKGLGDSDVDAFGLGARTVIGSADSRGTLELYGQLPESGPKLLSGSVGGELSLTRSVWLEFQAGAQKGGELEGAAGMFTRANIKYGSSMRP